MKKNIIQEKSFSFALRIIKLYKFLIEEKKEYILSRQILRSGTSIGANIEETIGAGTRKEFLQKVNISYRESRETLYWLKLLEQSQYISQNLYTSLFSDCYEIIKILGSIQKTTKNSL